MVVSNKAAMVELKALSLSTDLDLCRYLTDDKEEGLLLAALAFYQPVNDHLGFRLLSPHHVGAGLLSHLSTKRNYRRIRTGQSRTRMAVF